MGDAIQATVRIGIELKPDTEATGLQAIANLLGQGSDIRLQYHRGVTARHIDNLHRCGF
jgi:hypothetical protein